MSMTWEEAIAVLAESKRQNEVMRDNPSTFWVSHQMADGVKNAERRISALEIALSALRPVSREQVEKVWGPCNFCAGAKYITGGVTAVYPVSETRLQETFAEGDFDFCPVCGRPLTDEAVQMVMERLEATNDKLEESC